MSWEEESRAHSRWARRRDGRLGVHPALLAPSSHMRLTALLRLGLGFWLLHCRGYSRDVNSPKCRKAIGSRVPLNGS